MFEDLLLFLAGHLPEISIALVLGYLLGSVNFAILITDSFSHTDIRNFGSGNAGMTNVMRSVGKRAGYLTFLGDFAKGFFAVLIGMFVFLMIDSAGAFSEILDSSLYGSQEWRIGGYIGGLGCVIGHLFPLYHEFRGGKGVSAAAGMVLATDWRVALILLAVFFGMFLVFRIISLSSVSVAVAYPIAFIILTYFIDFKRMPDEYTALYCVFTTAVTVIVSMCLIIKHHSNIKRLINGTEKKLTIKKEG